MKIKKYFFLLAVVAGTLWSCALCSGQLPEADDLSLLGQPNPALAGIEQLYVVIVPPDAEPNKDGLLWKNLEAVIKSKISQTGGVKIAQAIQNERILRSLDIPELRIDINMLKLVESQQYVFYVRTSLAKKVFLTKDSSQCIKADVWMAGPVMQATSVQSMPAVVTSTVLEQIEAFIHAYLAANPSNRRPSDANDISIVPKEQIKPVAKSTPAEYKYLASKNSKVFHNPDCTWAKRISPENLVGYNSKDEAINTGKRPCLRCKP